MNKFFSVAAAASVAVCALSSVAFAEGKVIGVSWSNFQEERWKTDEAAMKAAIEANGDTYISADAQLSASKQLTDVESLIAQGADALVILSVDSGSVGAAASAVPAPRFPQRIPRSPRHPRLPRCPGATPWHRARSGCPPAGAADRY